MQNEKQAFRKRLGMLQPLIMGYWHGFVNMAGEMYGKDPESCPLKDIANYKAGIRRFDDACGLALCEALSFGHMGEGLLQGKSWTCASNVSVDVYAAKFAADLDAVSAIWLNSMKEWKGEKAELPSLPGALATTTAICRWVSALGAMVGVGAMISAYFNGIPVEDIIA